MIESGIDYTQQLLAIIRSSNTETANYFIKIPKFDNNTTLILASNYDHHAIVKFLLTVHGIDENAKKTIQL